MKGSFNTFLLLSVLSIMLIAAGSWIGGMQGAIVAFFVSLLMNIFSYWFSDKIVLKRYRAREISSSENPRLYNMVEKLAATADLPMPRVYIVPDKTPNAFATGRNPSHAAVAATEGILQLLTDDELEGVMAHELSHVKNRDTLTSTVAATIVGAITLLGTNRKVQCQLEKQESNGPDRIVAASLCSNSNAHGDFKGQRICSRRRRSKNIRETHGPGKCTEQTGKGSGFKSHQRR